MIQKKTRNVEYEKKFRNNKIHFQKLDITWSCRVPFSIHKKYKKLSYHGRKTIQYKFISWLERELRKCK